MTQTALPQQGQQVPGQPTQQAQASVQPGQTGQTAHPQKSIPLKRKGAGLNQLIAKTHKLGGQLLGLQITNGNLIAIFFSAMQITAGIVSFAWIMMGAWALVLTLVCAPLAVLIERLSLGGLMVYRTAGKGKMELEDSYHIKHIKKEATEREKYEYRRKLKRLRSDRWTSGWLILLGVAISGYVGDQFWQKLFAPIGPVNSTILSILIAGSVSLTFVFSELYAEPSNKGIREAMMDNQISKAVLANSKTDLQIELSMEAFGNLRSDPAKRLAVVNKIEEGMTTRLLDFAERAEYLLMGEDEQKTSPKVQIQEVTQGLQLPAIAQSRVEFEQCKEELAETLRTRPRMSRQKLADHFGVPKSTMQDWVTKLRKEAQQQEEAAVEKVQAEEVPVEDEQDVLLDTEAPVEGDQDQIMEGEVEEIAESYPDYADCKAELAELLRDRPRMSRQKLADQFGVPKSTMLDWIEAIRKEAKAEEAGA
ncbi:hypothetical protein [Dictyobacter arantiisoli]|uniref:Uncharacterized protein n=1 Tax=Dictyobacter arantiisoli TaxID=2014874 RepID=A0A5A5TIT4_9CHLR|nr:hypothetical protein [Dictyobacter arantiisoli]GCF10899.1 hypothetical protein KDI_44630 [Dictyobacter arantiisoli]